jgi:hypothetical protein
MDLYWFLGIAGFSLGANVFRMVGATNTSVKEKSLFHIIAPIGPSKSDTLDC